MKTQTAELQRIKVKGFNVWLGLISLAVYHTSYIYATRTLLYEMGPFAGSYMTSCFFIFLLSGFIGGRIFGYQINVAKKWKKVKKELDNLSKNL